ncbi:hypothetical protein PLESTB_000606600 [Pleodorina starrii]|uniref:Uncharacterized protein n=1 Tax=Pleodorina starrii TaxID=330485 RepID=A0A9W6BIB9_9CHLO|nr:hypothetical protein PLESTM_000427600 [Pleodorina starrii]GLC52300.1 hypothetical protein PLESTB_000606600 [Pleodorina starrii]GLC76079.1 hypothetical protein PLESTF_001732200 [Pleodorina starrii]
MLLRGRPCPTVGSHMSRRSLKCRGQAVNTKITGTWQKDMSRSTSMDAVANLVGLSGLVKEGIKLIRGCEIAVDGSTFRMGVFSVVPIVKINESYPLDGKEASNMRRDLRFGTCRGALALRDDGTPLLRLRWDEPYRGEGLDEFRLVGQDELHVVSSVTVGGRTVSYTSVHTRKA